MNTIELTGEAKMEMKKIQARAAIELIKTVADAIKEVGRIPSGHLYAAMMNTLSLEQYNDLIALLKRTNLIEEANNELIWRG